MFVVKLGCCGCVWISVLVLKCRRSSVSSNALEVVLMEIVGDFIAEHGPLLVGGAEVDARPHTGVDYFLKDV